MEQENDINFENLIAKTEKDARANTSENVIILKALIKERKEKPDKRAEINPKILEKLAIISNPDLFNIVFAVDNQLVEKELRDRLKMQKIMLKELFYLLEHDIFHGLVWGEIERNIQIVPQEDIIEIVKEFVGTCFLEDHPRFAKAISNRIDIDEIVEKIKDIKKGHSDTSIILEDLKFKRWQ